MATQNLSELSDEQILSAFLPSTAVKELVAAYGPVPKVLSNCFLDELARLRGIGPVKARQLQYICELAKRIYQTSLELPPVIRSPQDVADRMAEMQHLSQEEFRILLLNTKNHILAQRTLTIGTVNASLVSPTLIFSRAVKMMAVSIVLVHNHPSGDPMPSPEDISLTKKLVEAGKIMDIPIVDHIIIGMGKHVSFKEKGLI